MGLWLQMTGCFKGAVNYFESKSKPGCVCLWVCVRGRGDVQLQGVSMPLTFPSIRIHTLHISFSWHLCRLLQLRLYGAFCNLSQHMLVHQGGCLRELKVGFKMVNWSSEGFIGELSFCCMLFQPFDPQAHTWYWVRLQPGSKACRSRPGASQASNPLAWQHFWLKG